MFGPDRYVMSVTGINEAASTLHHIGELAGVVAFAASGALTAVRRHLDVVGIMLLSVATSLGGGVIRDVMIGNTPPSAFTNMQYLICALIAGAVVCVWHPPFRYTRWPLDITDAIGLGLFAVTGTVIAYSAGLNAPGSALLGMTTAIGGGAIRDVLTGQVPSVLLPQQHLYAIPALLCSSTVAALLRFAHYQPWMGLVCAAMATAVRLASLRFSWHGPQPWYVARWRRDRL